MNAAAGPRPSLPIQSARAAEVSWSRGRWLAWVLVVFGAQVGFIFVLSDEKPVSVRQPSVSPQLSMATESDELLALDDPTLFALPHAQGFSGAAWMQMPRVETGPFQWSEAPQWLPIPAGQLASTFTEFMQTNRFRLISQPLKSTPQLTVPNRLQVDASPEATSTLRLDGDLAGRAILNPQPLAAQTGSDLLPNTSVQVIVDSSGKVFSAVLLPPGSGVKEVDQSALSFAKATRFEPLPSESASAEGGLNWTRGRMIFQWRTDPIVQTNLPVVNP